MDLSTIHDACYIMLYNSYLFFSVKTCHASAYEVSSKNCIFYEAPNTTDFPQNVNFTSVEEGQDIYIKTSCKTCALFGPHAVTYYFEQNRYHGTSMEVAWLTYPTCYIVYGYNYLPSLSSVYKPQESPDQSSIKDIFFWHGQCHAKTGLMHLFHRPSLFVAANVNRMSLWLSSNQVTPVA